MSTFSLTNIAERLLRSANFNLLIPFIPGGVLVFGELLISKEAAKTLTEFPKAFGYATSPVLIVFAVYTSGILLVYAVNAFTEAVGWSLGNFTGKKITGNESPTSEPALHEPWRRTAELFLGKELAPRSPEEQIDQHNDWLTAWRQWSLIIDLYFPPTAYELPSPKYDFSSCIQACGWAGIILLSFGLTSHWFTWAVCLTAVISGFLSQFFFGIARATVLDAQILQTAAMLRELRSRNLQAEAVELQNESSG